MKLKLLFAFIALSLVACSGEDDTVSTNPVGEKRLDKIVESSYSNGSSVKNSVTQFDDNNRPINVTYYNASNGIIGVREYIYDMSGQLKTYNNYIASSGLNEPKYTDSYFYDTAGRINKIIHTQKYTMPENVIDVTTVDYMYTDNVITAKSKSTLSGVLSESVFEVNNEGLINKITSGNDTDEYIYDGDNVVFYGGTSHFPAYQYEYDMTTQPVGQYVHLIKNQYGSINNAIIAGQGFIGAHFLGSNYITKVSQNNGNIYSEFEYEFDSEGYPVIVKSNLTDSSIPDGIREIFYK